LCLNAVGRKEARDGTAIQALVGVPRQQPVANGCVDRFRPSVGEYSSRIDASAGSGGSGRRRQGLPMAGPVEMVLCDLGDVLVQLRGVVAMKELAGIVSDADLWCRWLTCPWVRRFESGQCSDEDFAYGMVDAWDLSISPSLFPEEFRSWPVGPLRGAAELVTEVVDKLRAEGAAV